VFEEKPMPVEFLTYGALGARLKISPEAARSFAKRHRLPRSLSEDGRALVSIDLAEVRHTPQPPNRRLGGDIAPLTERVVALQAEIAALEVSSAGHRADFEHERERADRLMVELLQATAEATAAREAAARLEGEVTALRASDRTDSLMTELLQATAEATAAREAAARLEGEVTALRASVRTDGSVDSNAPATRLGHLAASLVNADRKAARG
jgi:hypothetical protein